jgi:hypothetical protein
MVKLAWDTSQTESAILLEIWNSGGLLQTDCPVPAGSSVRISSPKSTVCARIDSCNEDDYGYLLEFSVVGGGDWFPETYRPAYVQTNKTVRS